LNETVTFTIEGLKIEGEASDGNVIQFSLAPGEEKKIKLATLVGGFSFGMGNSYSITSESD